MPIPVSLDAITSTDSASPSTRTVSVPGPGIASMALFIRFVNTCIIWSRSSSACGSSTRHVDRQLHPVGHHDRVRARPHELVRCRPPAGSPGSCVRSSAARTTIFLHRSACSAIFFRSAYCSVFGVALLKQQLAVQQHHAQRVVDLVGDAGGELAHARELLRLHQRLLRAGELLVCDRPVRRLPGSGG